MVLLAWAVAVWAWQDPFTGLYTRWQQHQLAARYPRFFATYRYLAFGKLVSVAVRGTTRISPTALAAAASA